MNKQFITVKSVTNAMKSKELLQKQGFEVMVERAPSHLNPDGCSFGIKIIKGNVSIAENILSTSGIDVLGRYGGVSL